MTHPVWTRSPCAEHVDVRSGSNVKPHGLSPYEPDGVLTMHIHAHTRSRSCLPGRIIISKQGRAMRPWILATSRLNSWHPELLDSSSTDSTLESLERMFRLNSTQNLRAVGLGWSSSHLELIRSHTRSLLWLLSLTLLPTMDVTAHTVQEPCILSVRAAESGQSQLRIYSHYARRSTNIVELLQIRAECESQVWPTSATSLLRK
jgi:hypothetical protein